MTILNGRSWRHWRTAVEDSSANALKTSGSCGCFRAVDVDAGVWLNFDATEECGKQELIAVVIVEREGTITLFEAAELGGICGKGWPFVAVAMAV